MPWKNKQIIQEIIEAYAGYPDRTKISRSVVNFLRALDPEKFQNLYQDIAAFEPMTMERLTLAIGHFQALNGKTVYEEGPLPSYDEKSIGIDKFQQCKKICIAAGRCNQVLKEEIIGSSPSILEVKKQTWHACFGKELVSSLDFKQAIKDLNVHISGETGTGKELFARAVQASAFWHDDYKLAPTASVNVAAFTEGLIDSELFGHKKGAFTGAMQDRDGLLRASHNGTFFLDEVGDLPIGTQVKLLRVIETKKVRPSRFR